MAAFTGTLDKCKACDKTVYFVDLLTADGSIYHKSCFRCSHCKGTLVTRAPSKLSAMFCGTQDKCPACNKTVYPLEKVTMEGESFHKSCFKCAHGGCPLTHSSYAALDGILYCKVHFQQLFMEKGNYQHVLDAATHKKSAVEMVQPDESEQPEEEAQPEPEPEAKPDSDETEESDHPQQQS
ncbi:hypothetical protein DH2020_002239 [Rehmannia glutinosa]|uniref:LIM zinc-binding domain-containing protein n=1 Tax=Rehmannia glutinosa TaxID=99300 RepID=A0ABR0XTN2_REHGL